MDIVHAPDMNEAPYSVVWFTALGNEVIGRTSRLVIPDWIEQPRVGYVAIAGYDEQVRLEAAIAGDDLDGDWFAQARREAEQADRRGA